MDDWIDYEAFVFASGGDLACPVCGIGILIPATEDDAVSLCRDVCHEVFAIADDDN